MIKALSEEAGPHLFAYADPADTVDVFAATLTALAALALPDSDFSIKIETHTTHHYLSRDYVPVEEAIALMRSAFTAESRSTAAITLSLRPDSYMWLMFCCVGGEYERRYPSGPLQVSQSEWKDVIPHSLDLALCGGERDVGVEAAILAMQGQEDTEAILIALCAPDASKRVVMGTFMGTWPWGAPLEACATYHADAGAIAHDLALSWVNLHDGDPVARIAEMSLEALQARVEAAPREAHVPVARNLLHVFEHSSREDAFRRTTHQLRARMAIAGDVLLSREAVLQALRTPPALLLEALEAAAVPDDEWRAVESRALAIIEATKAGEPTSSLIVNTGRHTMFVERYAPYHVRRLPNGGVMLATHPLRTLWQLYADALFLLGITP